MAEIENPMHAQNNEDESDDDLFFNRNQKSKGSKGGSGRKNSAPRKSHHSWIVQEYRRLSNASLKSATELIQEVRCNFRATFYGFTASSEKIRQIIDQAEANGGIEAEDMNKGGKMRYTPKNAEKIWMVNKYKALRDATIDDHLADMNPWDERNGEPLNDAQYKEELIRRVREASMEEFRDLSCSVAAINIIVDPNGNAEAPIMNRSAQTAARAAKTATNASKKRARDAEMEAKAKIVMDEREAAKERIAQEIETLVQDIDLRISQVLLCNNRHVYVCVCMCVYMYMYVCICICMCVYMYACMYICMRMSLCTILLRWSHTQESPLMILASVQ